MPRNPSKKDSIQIMWIRTNRPVSTGIWTPNHFVPLVAGNYSHTKNENILNVECYEKPIKVENKIHLKNKIKFFPECHDFSFESYDSEKTMNISFEKESTVSGKTCRRHRHLLPQIILWVDTKTATFLLFMLSIIFLAFIIFRAYCHNPTYNCFNTRAQKT